MSEQVSAFAGAVGYGAETVGGRGGQVITVTNLNDDGVGSLRWALEDVSGPRTVVFAVSGVISLSTQILIENPNVTIAGQTAPGDGVTIEGARIRVKADEVIVRGLKFRPGDGADGSDPGDRDGLYIGTTDFEINNVIVDHNSFTWAVDENLSINGKVHDVTVSNNIIAQGLSNSIHPKGEHSKGMLISNWEGGDDWDANISIVNNLFAGNMQRNPEVRAGQNIEIVNNLIYDYGLGRAAIAVGGGNNGTLVTTVNIVGNVMTAGPDTDSSIKRGSVALSAMGAGSAVYMSDNLMTSRPTDAAGDQVQTSLVWNNGGLAYVTSTATFGSGLSVLDSSQVTSYVLANVGAANTHRDAIDATIVAAVSNGQAIMVDSVAEAGGYLARSNETAAVDTDRDGMPNWFENLYGFNAKVADNNGDSDGDGYTNVEEYINGLISGFDLPLASTVRAAAGIAGAADTLTLGADAFGAPVVVANFNAAEGDHVDISALVTGVTDAAGGLAAFVDMRQVNGDTIISIDRDGNGTAYDMQAVAVIKGAAVVTLDTTVSAAQAQVPVGRTQTGDATANTLKGDAGVDLLYGLDGDDSLTGAAGDDRLYGGAGKDKLDGGAGADIMEGGLDDDTYIVDNAGDLVIEAAGEGVDMVNTSVSYTLAAEVENMAQTGSAAIDGWGNALANKITGNAGANKLYGFTGDDDLRGGAGDDYLDGGDGNDKMDGGAGADVMVGGLGDDIYVVDSASDLIVEALGAGADSVSASVTFGLSANVENLTLTGTATIDGAGNELANKLTGNTADNVLYGMAGDDVISGGTGADTLVGGAGRDQLTGGAGRDIFVFGSGDASIDGAKLDQILDFKTGEDLIRLQGVNGAIDASDMQSAWISSNTYAAALTKAQSMVAQGAHVAYVAGTSDGWLFWDDPATAATIDGAVLIKSGGSATAAAFATAPDLTYTDLTL